MIPKRTKEINYIVLRAFIPHFEEINKDLSFFKVENIIPEIIEKIKKQMELLER